MYPPPPPNFPGIQAEVEAAKEAELAWDRKMKEKRAAMKAADEDRAKNMAALRVQRAAEVRQLRHRFGSISYAALNPPPHTHTHTTTRTHASVRCALRR